ncbi:dicarboxylate transporter/tellurite-resistance protein TehA [Ancylobacter defluvii]|uniref:Dicarboxylate transporter/tellurite-resistance protein TehA n=1 Tax=Ancylobacter defluvii TaxID=1282440 RepID=A0A9W6K1Z1_9HYPH|nr:dicarboxylate transporter/tellurite-resistance protein TehA [Ancylobacter defluvii]MBS7587053.1 dicarboxylate transporter/tellurite-resistance protein TehA [Ancylobacter defluvii]GLK85463.1 dicarboxylate transporter/tellurite-resistance protein TehA [Ancylobacter defluvii]
MSPTPRVPVVPASFFGMVLGLAGLGGSWRAAHLAWGLPLWPGEALMATAAAVWAVLVVLYLAKWLGARAAAMAEAAHPIQCCFVGLIGVATMLVAGGIAPYSRGAALVLYAAGAVFTLGFAVWRTGGLWLGERSPEHSTPVLYLPTVAGSFVAGTVGAALGLADLGQFFFGAGLFGWLAIESVLLHRMLTSPNMASALRPTLGIQLAPPVVGAVTLISIAPTAPPLFAHAMIGYGLLQALILLRLLPWILREPIAPSYWAFTFGITALATAPTRLVALGDDGSVTFLAPILFIFANAVVLLVAAGTVYLAAQGRLLPASPSAAAAATPK